MTQDGWLVETYFDWLRSDCFSLTSERREYEGVLRVLHDIPFYWTIWSDENRAGDALGYRQSDFLAFQTNMGGIDQHWLHDWACAAPSVLEVLLGCARRWNSYYEGAIPYYFGHMFLNMDFNRHPGRVLTSAGANVVRERCDTWMSHQFQPNGVGSPFPVYHTTLINENGEVTDMTHLDIWSQMNAYSLERFQ